MPGEIEKGGNIVAAHIPTEASLTTLYAGQSLTTHQLVRAAHIKRVAAIPNKKCRVSSRINDANRIKRQLGEVFTELAARNESRIGAAHLMP
jgi:hypothetical protein